ncbi:MAG: TatD family hydrolase, partial [Gammaproteobacteria bacterium]|nr:TatD family hydrolase [Gammaproteobacteria bacterium]
MFVDSHCHLDCIDLADFDGSFDALIQQASKAEIEHMLCVSINLEKYPAMLALVESYPQISVSVGVHPMHDQEAPLDLDYIKKLASNPKVVAIGETGLDYYYHKGDNQKQTDYFRSHIQIANDLNKPVIVHTRDAGDDTLEILRSES